MVEAAAGGRGTRAIRTDYPVDEGLTAGTTKLKDDWTLRPEESSLISPKEKVGL